jgi:murein DD-endopeptidase MepM/ murein hydrolase activator NlpD
MNIILVGKRHGQSRSIKLRSHAVTLLILLAMLVAFALVALGAFAAKAYYQVDQDSLVDSVVIDAWSNTIKEQKKDLRDLERESRQTLDALTLKMGDMQARIYRLDALGQRLTEVAKLKNGEFDFQSQPSVGGPIEESDGESYTVQGFENELKTLAQTIADREQQLGIMEQLFDQEKLANDAFIAGRPIKWGWMSSPYGYRSDPFTGKRAWHAGVDFAGKDGSDIISVAAGVVTWSGQRYGYGNLVEVNHGDGYTTRYAHCKELLVEVGDIVEKGEVLARMGSTGRSTGPHVHYEVLKNGRPENPKKFIYRASRG